MLALALQIVACGSSAHEKPDEIPTAPPCEGIMPAAVGPSVTVPGVPSDPTPFPDALVGNGQGSIIFFASDEVRQEFWASVYAVGGKKLVGERWGKFADRFGPRPLPQRWGFQLREGDTINIARLQTYDSRGELVASTSLKPAHEMVSALDPNGGSLVISDDTLPGRMNPYYPWMLRAQCF